MLLATRCPFCETVFRLQPGQLAVRRGLVRCGHCHESFDASGSLYDVPEDGDFANAVPVGAEAAARLIAGGSAAEAVVPEPVVPEPVVPEPVVPEPVVPEPVVPEPAVPEPVVPEPAVPEPAVPEPVAPEPTVAEPVAPEPAAPSPAAPASTASPSAPPPDFGTPAWDPWAPRADSRIDERLLFTADRLPMRNHAPSVTPKPIDHPAEPRLAPEPAATEPAPPPIPRADERGHVEPTLSANEASLHPLDDHEPVLPDPIPVAGSRREPAREPEREPAREPKREPPRAREAKDTAAATAAATASPAFSSLAPDDGPAPFAVTREAPVRSSRRRAWNIVGVVVALILLLLLAAQLAWWLRETVMVYWPGSQPLYVQACRQLGCQVQPPRNIDGLQVLPSGLRQVDDAHHLELKVPLRNRSDVALAYPAIELTLLDPQNNVVIRRVLHPQDYVKPGTRVEDGLPAHTTQTMIVRLDTGNITASNFRIEIFYP